MSNRLCNRCQFNLLVKQHPKNKVELRKVKKTEPLKGWMQVFIDDKPQETYYMSVSKKCDC